jgi:hypothetical protein
MGRKPTRMACRLTRPIPVRLEWIFTRVNMLFFICCVRSELTGAARFSPDDKFSRHRVTLKKRFNVLLTQMPEVPV